MATKQLIKKSAGAGQDGIKDPLIDAEEGLTEPFGDEPVPKPRRYTRKFWIVGAIIAAVACAAVVAVGGAAYYLLRPPPPRSMFHAEHMDHAPPRKMVALVNKPPVEAEELPELSVIDTVSSNAESMAAAAAPSPDGEPKVALSLVEEPPNAVDVAVVPTTVAVAVFDDGATASNSDKSRQESQGTAAAAATGEALLWDDYFFGEDDAYRSYEAEGVDDEDDELYQDGDDSYSDDDYQIGSFDPFDGDDDYFDLYQDDPAVQVDQSSSPSELDDGIDDDADPFDKPVGIYDYSDDNAKTSVESSDELQSQGGESEWIFGDLDDYDYATGGQEESVKEDEEEEKEEGQQLWSESNVASDDYSDSTFDDTAVYYRGDEGYASAAEDEAGADVADVSDLFDVVYDQEEPSNGGGEDGRQEEEEAIAAPYTYYDDAERLPASDPVAYEQRSQSEADDDLY